MSPTLQVVLAGVGTYLLRISAIAMLSGSREIPERVENVLRLIPPSVLAALVVQTWLVEGGTVRALDAWWAAGAVAFAIALWRRSAGWTLLAGMLTLWAIRGLA